MQNRGGYAERARMDGPGRGGSAAFLRGVCLESAGRPRQGGGA